MATSDEAPSIRESSGALVLGCYFGLFLSGILAMQVYIYFKLYSKDKVYLKGLVTWVWFLDFVHTLMACNGNWSGVIVHFGDKTEADHISWSISTTVALTAAITFTVHCFFTYRIYVLSKRNKFLAIPLGIIALLRLVGALVLTAKMIQVPSYKQCTTQYSYLYTMGLCISLALDFFITAGMAYYLRKSKTGFSNMNEILNTLILYTTETGLSTSVTTAVTLICWMRMPNNLIFLGIHFAISKLYANSLLANLNSRASLRSRHALANEQGNIQLPVLLNSSAPSEERTSQANMSGDFKLMRIHVEKSIHTETASLRGVPATERDRQTDLYDFDDRSSKTCNSNIPFDNVMMVA